MFRQRSTVHCKHFPYPASPSVLRHVPLAAAALAAFILAGCGGGGGNDQPPTQGATTPETLFIPSNAWNGPVPADAQSISSEEFRRLYESGDLALTSPSSQEARSSARRRKLEEDRAFLESKTDLSEDVKALLAEARVATNLDAQPVTTLPTGERLALIELGTRIEHAAETYRRVHDPANALATYTLSYSLLTEAQRATLPTPESLREATLEQIQDATKQLDDLLATTDNLDSARLDPDAPVEPMGARAPDRSQKQKPGNGVDNDGTCSPMGLARRYWFPLRSFVPPVKMQGERGTCWAFAAIASVETRERVQNNNAADLSEQFLVNKVKREWFESDFIDGGSAANALNAAIERNQGLLSEAGWTYNPAYGRPDTAFDNGVAGTISSYDGACDGYDGWCSKSAHQSERSCTSVLGFSFCGYNKMVFNEPGVPSGRVRTLWSNGQAFNLNQYRALLSSGVSLMASFPLYDGFNATPSTGLVTDYAKQMKDASGKLVDGNYGGHLVQVVGFISNEEMSYPGSAPSNIGGGGYFIIRNSWGCTRGDNGYFYVPADYVSSLFSTLEVLDFDARRAQRWLDEQVTPGGTAGLNVDAKGTSTFDLRTQSNLVGHIGISHPVANYVRLTVTSDRDGTLYNGQWMTNQPIGGSLFGNSLPVVFQTEGVRTLTITARYGAQTVAANKQVVVVNSAPSIRFENVGIPQEGEDYAVNAIVTDKNDSDTAATCAAMSWTVTAPDAIVAGTGCARTVRFGIAGLREVRVATHDPEGLAAAAIGSFNVAPPPANPYPRVTKFGLYSRDKITFGGFDLGCGDIPVPNQAVVDLRRLGCWSFLGEPPTKYFAAVETQNPLAETLSYDWTHSTYLDGVAAPARVLNVHTTEPSYNMIPIVFGGLNWPYRCTLDVRVNAPEAARSKSLRVWSGQCINIENAPR